MTPVRPVVPTRADVDRLMKRCQIGVGGRRALDDAHSIMADCYGTLGALMMEVEVLRAWTAQVGSTAGLGAWGRDDLMAIAAVRYCLGRMTYITSDCSEWLVAQWPNIKPNARAVIQRDIDEAFARDDEARESGDSYKPLGWDCDRAVWQKVRELWAPNAKVSG